MTDLKNYRIILPARKAAWDRLHAALKKAGYAPDQYVFRYAWKHDHDYYNPSKDMRVWVQSKVDEFEGPAPVLELIFLTQDAKDPTHWNIGEFPEWLWHQLVKIADIFKQRQRRVTIYMDDWDRAQLRFVAKKRHESLSETVRDLVRQWIWDNGLDENFHVWHTGKTTEESNQETEKLLKDIKARREDEALTAEVEEELGEMLQDIEDYGQE